MKLKPLTHYTGNKKSIIYNYGPNWYSIVMGTGILSISIHSFPFKFKSQYEICMTLYVLNIMIFVIITLISIVRYTLKPSKFFELLNNPPASMFIGAVPMAFSTIVNGLIFLFPVSKYRYVPNVALVLWSIDVFLALFSYLVVPMYSLLIHKNSIKTISSIWLLPMVPPIVSSGAGAAVAGVLNPDTAHVVIIISYILWGMGVVAFLKVPTYLYRLYAHGYPPKEIMIAAFLPVGLFGQSGNAIMSVGNVSAKIFPKTIPQIQYFGEACEVCTMILGLLLVGFALFFLIQSIAATWFIFSKEGAKFNVSWWAITFPLGTFNQGIYSLAISLDSMAFRVFGSCFTIVLSIIWIYIFAKTFCGVWTGTLFIIPPPPIPTINEGSKQS
ncbi:hypothetical protein BB559_005382 [Furculomyces boomerangus]|uniref:Sulfite efflux pump SSU1 n=1 Tax=Furculomyces boomerangus TaxID=61424 RepID=A0A2T9Y915_9FUNG|nr:hypothetical protein BB559_005382 [Furculomyces boomerangus]